MAEQTDPQQTDPQQTNPPQPRNQCRHVHLADSRRCGSPCLRGENFCYYHHSSRRRPKHLGQPPLDAVFTMLPIDDAPSIQLALADILARICTRSLDNKRASLVLYGLSIASLNLKRGHQPGPNPKPSEVNAVIEDLELDPTLGPLAPVARMDDPAQDETRKTLMQKFVEYCERPPHACKECARRVVIDANKAEGRRLMAELNRRRAANLPEYDPPLNFHTPYPADATWGAEERRQGLSTGLPLPYPAAPAAPTTGNQTGAPSELRMGGSSFAEANDPPTPEQSAGEAEVSGRSRNRHPDPEPVEAEEPVLSPSKEPASAFSTPPPHAESPNEPGLPNPTQDTWAKFAAHLPNPDTRRRT